MTLYRFRPCFYHQCTGKQILLSGHCIPRDFIEAKCCQSHVSQYQQTVKLPKDYCYSVRLPSVLLLTASTVLFRFSVKLAGLVTLGNASNQTNPVTKAGHQVTYLNRGFADMKLCIEISGTDQLMCLTNLFMSTWVYIVSKTSAPSGRSRRIKGYFSLVFMRQLSSSNGSQTILNRGLDNVYIMRHTVWSVELLNLFNNA